MRKQLPENPRILITRTDRIGDLVISSTVFQFLRKKYPNAHLAACVFREHRELVEGNPFLNEVLLYEKSGNEKSLLGQMRFSQFVRRKKFDCVIHLHATNRMHMMGWLAGIPIRVGYDRRASWALTDVHSYDKKEGQKHESEYLLQLASELITPPCENSPPQDLSQFSKPVSIAPFPFVPVTAGMQISVENLLLHHGIQEGESFAVIHPSASDITKMWPAEKFAELMRTWKVARHWVAIGDSQASGQVHKISALSGLAIVNLCGKLSLGMLAALFGKSEIVISNDSGPAHIAAATGAPTISIFGRWQPGLNAERWKPLGRHVAIVTPQIQAIPEAQRKFSYVDDIAVEEVRAAARTFLRGDAT